MRKIKVKYFYVFTNSIVENSPIESNNNYIVVASSKKIQAMEMTFILNAYQGEYEYVHCYSLDKPMMAAVPHEGLFINDFMYVDCSASYDYLAKIGAKKYSTFVGMGEI